jgi:hypothetical protein
MALNCLGVRGCASGSLFAAAVMVLSSSTVGIRTVGRLAIFDIVFHLASIGTAKADKPSHFATIYKRHVVQDFGFRSERDHPRFVVFKPTINSHQRGFPIKFYRHGQ